jgi:hypothetical protein
MLQLSGTVVDSQTGAALAGATLTLDGTPIGVTDSNGHFDFTTASEGQSLTISYVGYNNNEYPVDMLSSLSQIPMTLSSAATNLAPVTVTPSSVAVTNKPAAWLPLVLAGGVLVLLGSGKKKKSVGKVDTSTILLAGGAAVALYFITRPAPVAVAPPVPVYSAAYLQSNAGNPVAQDISAGAQVLPFITNLISSF